MRAQPALCLLSILAGSLTAQRPDSNRAPDRPRSAPQPTRPVHAPDFTWLDSISKWPRAAIGFSEARWNEYRGLFTNLTLREGIVRTEDFPGAIFFVARVRGLCVGGSSAGYVYSNTPLTPTADLP